MIIHEMDRSAEGVGMGEVPCTFRVTLGGHFYVVCTADTRRTIGAKTVGRRERGMAVVMNRANNPAYLSSSRESAH